jgi:hypothetical protein
MGSELILSKLGVFPIPKEITPNDVWTTPDDISSIQKLSGCTLPGEIPRNVLGMIPMPVGVLPVVVGALLMALATFHLVREMLLIVMVGLCPLPLGAIRTTSGLSPMPILPMEFGVNMPEGLLPRARRSL